MAKCDVPHVPPELVEWLEDQIPERCAKLKETERDIFFYAGRRAVVTFLKQTAQDQEKEYV